MAGNYADVPSWRMAYDRDGTQGFKMNSGVLTQLTNANLITINNEADDYINIGISQNQAGYLILLFPEKRDLDGYWITGSDRDNFSAQVQTSTNTTNGSDGTWTNLGGTYSVVEAVVPNYRLHAQSATALGIRGVRISAGAGLGTGFNPAAVHLYGEISAGQSIDRLALWHPTLDERITPAYFDWGNVPRNTSASRTFRVKNLAAAKTANTVRVAMESLTDGSPSVPAQHTLSIGGGSYLPQQTIATLAPGALSDVLTLRRITPANAQLSLSAFRVFAEAATWS